MKQDMSLNGQKTKRGGGDVQMLANIRTTAEQVLPKDCRLILFGSQARGDAREDSDWDLLLLLQQKVNWSDAFDRYAFPFVELGWQHRVEVNPLIYTFAEWQKRQATPFYENIEKEGIEIAH